MWLSLLISPEDSRKETMLSNLKKKKKKTIINKVNIFF